MKKTSRSSIISNSPYCFYCGSPLVQKHHIFGGGLREVSEENGFWVYLCMNHHTGRCGVHGHPEKLRELRVMCQKKYLQTHSMEEWMKLMRRNYEQDDSDDD